MPPRLLIAAAVLALALFGPDGEEEGRRGNALYRQGRYAAAAQVYRAGLEARDGEGGALTARLWNNLGAALHRMGRHDEAQTAFARALAAAQAPSGLARAAYNAGNNAAARGGLRAALAFYRKALLADPSNERARFNYEYVKRRLQRQRGRKRGRRSSEERHRRSSSASNQQRRKDGGGSARGKRRRDGNRQTLKSPGRRKGGNVRPRLKDGTPRREKAAGRPQTGQRQQANRHRKLTRAQAVRLLRALAERERKLVRPPRKAEPSPRRVEKDW